jgi:hypothetical protein
MHCSVVSHQPQLAAKRLAQLVNGRALPFQARGLEGAWLCSLDDDDGQLIEFIPPNFRLIAGAHGASFEPIEQIILNNLTHIQIRTSVSYDEMMQYIVAEGLHFHCRPAHGGPLLEVWLEEQLMVELVSDEISRRSLNWHDVSSKHNLA